MAEKINYRQLSLKNVRFFFMDEYVDDEKDELIPTPKSAPASPATASTSIPSARPTTSATLSSPGCDEWLVASGPASKQPCHLSLFH